MEGYCWESRDCNGFVVQKKKKKKKKKEEEEEKKKGRKLIECDSQ